MTNRMNVPCTDLTMRMLAKHGFRTLDGAKIKDLPSQEGPFASLEQDGVTITARVEENETLEMVQVILEGPIPGALEIDVLTCVSKAAAANA